MLNSNRDKSIKRYLSKIGKLKHSSISYSSKYYEIPELGLVIRFSDHFKNNSDAQLEIIKHYQKFYTLKANFGFNLTCTEEHVLIYLKSFLLLWPELNDTVSNFKKAADTAVDKRNRIQNALTLLDIKEEENKEQRQQIHTLNNQVDSLQSKCNKLQKQVDLSSKLQKQVDLLSKKITKTRNALKEVTKDL